MTVEALAYRKAAKSVVLLLLGIPTSSSLLDPTESPERRLDKQTAELYATAELASHSAEQRFRPKEVGFPIEAARIARQLLRPFVSSEIALQPHISRLRLIGRKMIEDPATWRKIKAVARELLTQTRLSAADVANICSQVDETQQ